MCLYKKIAGILKNGYYVRSGKYLEIIESDEYLEIFETVRQELDKLEDYEELEAIMYDEVLELWRAIIVDIDTGELTYINIEQSTFE